MEGGHQVTVKLKRMHVWALLTTHCGQLWIPSTYTWYGMPLSAVCMYSHEQAKGLKECNGCHSLSVHWTQKCTFTGSNGDLWG